MSAEWDLWKDGVTQGFIQSFLNCREQTRLHFIEGWASRKTSQALSDGNLGHAILAEAYGQFRGAPPDAKWIDQEAEIQFNIWRKEHPHAMPNEFEIMEKSVLMMKTILPAYFEHWADDFTKKRWINIENTFNVTYQYEDGEKAPIRGRKDGVFKRNDKLWLFENKFKAYIDEEGLLDGLGVDLQCNLYLYALRRIHAQMPAGVLYNVIRRPALRQKRSESFAVFAKRCKQDTYKRPDHYFRRVQMTITMEEMNDWKNKFLAPVMIAIRAWFEGQEGTHFMNPGALFTKYGRSSMFGPICNNDFSQHYKRRVVFSELDDEF